MEKCYYNRKGERYSNWLYLLFTEERTILLIFPMREPKSSGDKYGSDKYLQEISYLDCWALFRIVMSQNLTESSQLKPLVTFTGAANTVEVGPPLGRVEIGSNENAYIFRVALPGVRGNRDNLKCTLQLDGRVHIEGAVAESLFAKNSSDVFMMKLQQLCPPGPFSLSFNLPGPVDPRLCSLSFRTDGILEVVAFKFRIPHLSAEGWFEKWYDCCLPS